MLTEYRGLPNSNEMFPHLIGEEIKAVLKDKSGHIVLILSSGMGLAFGRGPNYAEGPASFWPIGKEQVESLIQRHKSDIQDKLSQLGELA